MSFCDLARIHEFAIIYKLYIDSLNKYVGA